METLNKVNNENIKKCEKCLNSYNLEEQQKYSPDLGYGASKNYLNKCVECYHRGNLTPFKGLDQVKEHKGLIMWHGYQDKKGKECGLSECKETKKLLQVNADDDFEFGGLICVEHFKQYPFKLIGSGARTGEREFEPKKTKGETPNNAEEARQSLEDYKKMVNFNQFGNPSDRGGHFERGANKCGLTAKQAETLLNNA